MARVIVVGAGVIGLSCALRLAEDGHRVDVLARDLPRETTSAVAAALWHPGSAEPGSRVLGWAARSYEVFTRLAQEDASGVRMCEGTEVLVAAAPGLSDLVPDLARETALPAGVADGWTFTAPVVDMPVYLPYLVGRLERLGGTLTRMNLSALPDPGAAGGVDVVVHCAGLGARLFAADPAVVPVRGQVVVVEQFGLERWWLEREQPTYVVPRSSEVVIGSTEEAGEWSRTSDPEVARALLERAARLVPEVAAARVLRHVVGLRPARPEVRLERVDDVVHCYGHGGSGVTLSWGCAEEVAALVG